MWKKRKVEHKPAHGHVKHHTAHPQVPLERGKHINTESELVHIILKWIVQARATFLIGLSLIVVYFISLSFSPELRKSLIFTRESLLSLNFVPMVSSWFLHADLVHLSGNILFLFIFGRIAERKYGFFRFLLIYFTSAIISDIISGLIFGQGGIGASGAIAGVVAAAVIVNPFYLTYLFFGLPIPVLFIGWVALFSDITGIISPIRGDNVGHIAHLAGFFGISLIIYLTGKQDIQIKRGFAINIATFIVLFILYFLLPDNPFRGVFY